MTDIVASPSVEHLKAGLRKLLGVAVDAGLASAVHGVERLGDKLEDVTDSGGPWMGAAGGGVLAALADKNPVWGAIKGAAGRLSTGTKVLIVLAAVVALLLGPVVFVVALIVLLVLAIVAAVRSASRSPVVITS
jgi:hypothetical protein